jgi:tRNA-dihydrouridine synthase
MKPQVQLGFWKKVKENAVKRGTPIAVLAPMADVTDPAFRRIIAKYSRMGKPGGGPDVMWTEFVSADGLCSRGRDIVKRDLAFSPGERPIVAQLFTSHPEKMREAAKLCAELGFDGIDINMGCPDRTIEKQGAGAAMMKTPEIARAVIHAAKEGAPGLPISVKTRIGYNKVEIETWLPAILEEGVAVLTVHCRTRKEMSDVPAQWQYVKRAVEIRDEMQGSAKVAAAEGRDRTLIFGNGDVVDLADGHARANAAGADGAMLGRAIFGNPWLFDATLVSPKEIW